MAEIVKALIGFFKIPGMVGLISIGFFLNWLKTKAGR